MKKIKKYVSIFEESDSSFSSGDIVKIKDNVKKELLSLYKNRDGMSGVSPKYIDDTFIVDRPAYDGSNLRVRSKKDKSKTLSLSDSRFENFKESTKLKEGVEESLDSLLQKYIHGYGGPGIQNTANYVNTMVDILHVVATDLTRSYNDNDGIFSSSDKGKLKTLLNSKLLMYSNYRG